MLVVSVPTRNGRTRSGRADHGKDAAAGRLLASIDRWDARTARHCRRVAELATRLARTIDLSVDRVRLVRAAALLHDVGKITIPRRVLAKPGALTRPERRLLNEHAPRGQAILAARAMPGEMASIVRHHHQRYDGSGGRLCGTAIPLLSRLLSIVDAYEAMTGDRPYRPPVSHRSACLELKRHAGRQFDPALVADFLRTFAAK